MGAGEVMETVAKTGKPVPADKPIPYDLVRIVWLDASGDTGFKPVSEIKEERTKVTTVGFLIHKTRDHYLTGGSVFRETDGEYYFGDRNHIPRAMVKELTVIAAKPSRKQQAPNASS
jgi:hypothetical protein